MKQTERYLRQATRGLWGRARRDLQTELQGHVNERIQEFRLGGMSAEEAERQALRELGTPERVRSGMLGVHTFPALGKAGALSLLLATTLLTALPQSLAQVKGIYTTNTSTGPASYLNLEQLKAELMKVGGKISSQDANAVITLPGAARPPLPLNSYGFPSPILSKDNVIYIQTEALLYALQNTGLDIRVKGWENPVLMAGQSSIRIKTDDWQVANNLYAATVQTYNSRLWSGLKIPFSLIEPDSLGGNTSLKGQFKQGKIYALVSPKVIHWTGTDEDGKFTSGDLNIVTTVSQAQAGSVQFHVLYGFKDFKLYPSLDAFQAALKPSLDPTKLPYWDADHPRPALILELSGHFGDDAYTVVNPNTIHIK